MKNNITFIICTKNSIDTIESCLKSIKLYDVILVDKDSKDGTLVIAKMFKNVTIVNQKGNGLANARNLGLKYVKTKYVCMWGSDNELYCTSMNFLIESLENKKWVGIGFLTEIRNKKKYLEICNDIWWRNKITYGQKEVVGTPNIYITKILKKFKYNENCHHSDDSDLGKRLKEAGYKQGYSFFWCYDISKCNFKNLLDRFIRYGFSDKEYHNKYCKTLKQKIKSYLHPLKTEWAGFNLYYLPFYILIVIIRYIGRFK